MSSRFWVGGTGTWDSSTTTHWSATSGGAGGASVPGSSDAAIFNGSSGGGTVTLNFGGTITLQSLTIGDFTGTWDNSANNNDIVLTAASLSAFDNNGSGTRTINLGSATYTLSSAGAGYDSGASGLTISATSATFEFTGTSGNRRFSGGPKAYGTVIFAANSASGTAIIQVQGGSIVSLVLNAPLDVTHQAGQSAGTVTVLGGGGGSAASFSATIF